MDVTNDGTKESTNQIGNGLITRIEAARLLGVKPQTLSAWACLRRHDLAYYKIGSRAMYCRSDINAFIDRQMVQGINRKWCNLATTDEEGRGCDHEQLET